MTNKFIYEKGTFPFDWKCTFFGAVFVDYHNAFALC